MSKHLKTWICKFILQKQRHSARFCKAAVVLSSKGTTKKGWHVKEITDGSVYIQAIFTKSAVEKCLGVTGTHEDLNSAVLLLRDIRLELQHNYPNVPEFIIVVEDFVIWDHQRGFKLIKTSIKSCMEDSQVQDAVKLYVKTQRQAEIPTEMGDNMESQSLSVLLQEMAEASAESDTSIPGQQSCEMSMTEEDWVVKLTKPFDVKEFIIPNASDNILKGLREWDADYRIPASGDMVLQSCSADDYSMGILHTMEGQNERNVNSREVPEQQAKKVVRELSNMPPHLEKIPSPGTSVGYNQSQSERSCWQDCMDSVQLSEESLDLGQPDAHSTQVDKDFRRQDLLERRKSHSLDGANIVCNNGRGEASQQSPSVEIIEKNNSVILISSGSENSFKVLSKGSFEKVKEHDQAELKRLGALSVTSNNVSSGEFSHSELYRNSVLDKHLNSNKPDQTIDPKNKGSEDLFKDSTTSEENSGRSCDKRASGSESKDCGDSQATKQQDTGQNISSSNDSNESLNIPGYSSITENKENENIQNDVENRKNSQDLTTNGSSKRLFEKVVVGGSHSTVQRLRLCQELLGKKSVCKTSAKQTKSSMNTQLSNTVRSSQSSDDSLSILVSSDMERISSDLEMSVMWKYYTEGSPAKLHTCTDKVKQCDTDETVENSTTVNNSKATSTPTDIQIEHTTLNNLECDKEQDLDKQNYSLSLHTSYEFMQTNNQIDTESNSDKMQYMSSLELSPVEFSDKPVNVYDDIDEVIEMIDQIQQRSTDTPHTSDAFARLSPRPCYVVLEKLRKEILDKWECREHSQSGKNDTRRNIIDDSTQSHVMQHNNRVLRKRNNNAKTYFTKRPCNHPETSFETKSQSNKKRSQKEVSDRYLNDFNSSINESYNEKDSMQGKNVETEQHEDNDHSVSGSQPFYTVVSQSQGFVPISPDKEMAYLGPVVLSNSGADSFDVVSNNETAKTTCVMDNREIDVAEKDSESRQFLNQQTNRKAAIDRIKLYRKQHAEKLGIDIERLSNKRDSTKQVKEKESEISVDSSNYNEVDVSEQQCVGKEQLNTDENIRKTEKMKSVAIPYNTANTKVVEKISDNVIMLQHSHIVAHDTHAKSNLSENVGRNEMEDNQNGDENKEYYAQSVSFSNTEHQKILENTPAYIATKQHHQDSRIDYFDHDLLTNKEKDDKDEFEFIDYEVESFVDYSTDDEINSNANSLESSEIPVYNEPIGKQVFTNVNKVTKSCTKSEKTVLSVDGNRMTETLTNKDSRKTNKTFIISRNGQHKKSQFESLNTKLCAGRTNINTCESSTILVNGKDKGTESLTNHPKKRKKNEYIESEIGLERDDTTNKGVCLEREDAISKSACLERKDCTNTPPCLETSKPGSIFGCSDAEMDYLLSKCPSKRELLDCAKAHSTAVNLPSDECNIIVLFPVLKVLDKEYNIKPVNKKKEVKNDSNDFFSIPLKKFKRTHRRTDTIASDSEKGVNDSNSEYEESLFGFMQVAKGTKIHQSLRTYCEKSKRHTFEKHSRNKDKQKSCIHLCEESNIAGPSTSTDVGKSPDNTDTPGRPFNTADKANPGQGRSNLRLTVDRLTGACRFSRLRTAGHSYDNFGEIDKEPNNSSTLKGKGLVKEGKHESKGKQRCKEWNESGAGQKNDAENQDEIKLKIKNKTITDNKYEDALSYKSGDLNRNDVIEIKETTSQHSEVVRVKKKAKSHTKYKQKRDVKNQTNTSSRIERRSNQKNSDRADKVELPQHSLRKRKSNVASLTKESLKTHSKSKVNKDLFLQEWLQTSNFGASSEDDD